MNMPAGSVVRALAGEADRRRARAPARGPPRAPRRTTASGPRSGSPAKRDRRLVAHDLARVERDDRLEHDVELLASSTRCGSGRACVIAPRGRGSRRAPGPSARGGRPPLTTPSKIVSPAAARAQRRHQLLRRARRAPRSRRRPRGASRSTVVVVRPARVREHARVRRGREDRAHSVVALHRARCASTSATSGCSAAASSARLARRSRPRPPARIRRRNRARRSFQPPSTPDRPRPTRGQAPLPWAQYPPG